MLMPEYVVMTELQSWIIKLTEILWINPKTHSSTTYWPLINGYPNGCLWN